MLFDFLFTENFEGLYTF